MCTVAVDVVRLPYRNKLKWRQTAKSSFSADPQWTAVRVRLRRVTTDGVSAAAVDRLQLEKEEEEKSATVTCTDQCAVQRWAILKDDAQDDDSISIRPTHAASAR